MNADEQILAIAKDVCEKLRLGLGENLGSVILYGSSVRGDAVSGHSDINIGIILNQATPEAHRAIAVILRKFPDVSPFVLSRWELPRSRKVFALKFLSISRHYHILFGDDVLAGFAPSRSLLLFLCEQSLRNLRLRLKQAYIRHYDNPGRYAKILVENYVALITALSEVLRCEGISVPLSRTERPDLLGRQWGIDTAILNELRGLRKNSKRLSADEAFGFHAKLFRLLSAALDRIRQQWPQVIEI
jgi:predicted nucleotidyltransferase